MTYVCVYVIYVAIYVCLLEVVLSDAVLLYSLGAFLMHQ